MFKMDLERAEEPEIILPTSAGSQKKQESSRKTPTSASLTTLKAFDCVYCNKLWKILKETGIPDHLTCLLRNLCAGQEATVRTTHGTKAWLKIGKRVCQGCIQSPCLFNLYADMPPAEQTCMQVKKQHLELNMEQWTGPNGKRRTSRLYIVTLLT